MFERSTINHLLNSKATKQANGFTIVELLIVIVVIGILAAIVIVAYNGIQQKAENTKTISAVTNLQKMLLNYAQMNNKYPDGTNRACLGDTFYTSCVGADNATFRDNLRSFSKAALPMPSTKVYQYYGGPRAGAAFDYNTGATLDGQAYPWGINFVLDGRVPCGVANVAGNPSGQNWPNFSRTPNANGATESNGSDNKTYCRVILPDPSTL